MYNLQRKLRSQERRVINVGSKTTRNLSCLHVTTAEEAKKGTEPKEAENEVAPQEAEKEVEPQEADQEFGPQEAE